MEQQIRFCTTPDGVRIAYATVGKGPPLVMIRGWAGHLELEWDTQQCRTFYDSLAAQHTLVRYDQRGTGLSDRVSNYDLEDTVTDLSTLVDHVKLKRFALLASTWGGPSAITYIANHPRRVSRLILYGTFADGRGIAPPERQQATLSFVKAHWGLGSSVLMDISWPHAEPDVSQRLPHMLRESCSAEIAVTMISLGYQTDVTALLPRIKTPTLVTHRRRDRMIPFATGRELAALLPNARLLSLEGDVHAIFFPDVVEAINEFLAPRKSAKRKPTEAAAPSGLVTILFTDMEGSTALTQRLGDAKAQELLRTHNAIVRDALKAQDGAEIKHTGDGIMASFATASKALACATTIQTTFAECNETAEEPIKVRIGLNAGEPVAEDEDLFGTAVQLAARVCAHAQPGQVLASNVVRELAAGKPFLFSDQGDVVLRGFEDPVRLYEVRGG
jgi:class 3 adenylate cyclase